LRGEGTRAALAAAKGVGSIVFLDRSSLRPSTF